MKLGLLGPKGTFSDMAREIYEKKVGTTFETYYFQSLNSVFSNYLDMDLLIVPIENTLDGHVVQCLDEMLDKKLYIIDELNVDVRFSFVSNSPTLEEVKKINVQFKAKGQCVNFLNTFSCPINITESNIESLNLIKGKENEGAIIPHHVYSPNYNIAIEDVTDSKNNQTKFFILSKNRQNKGNKCYFVMKTIYDDRKGLLKDILKIIDQNGYNLGFILSRPTKTQLGKYNFFAEIDNIGDISLLEKTFLEIEKEHLAKVEILGIYWN